VDGVSGRLVQAARGEVTNSLGDVFDFTLRRRTAKRAVVTPVPNWADEVRFS